MGRMNMSLMPKLELNCQFQLPITVKQTTPKFSGLKQQPLLLQLMILWVGNSNRAE
jgi:hypothetical protein